MTSTTKLKTALGGLALIAAAVLPMASTPATAVPTAPAVASKPVPQLGYSTQTVRTLNIDFQYQQTGYWCGPAATRIALSARISPPSQQQLANELPTTTNGTDWIGQVTRVLNNHLGTGWYETK